MPAKDPSLASLQEEKRPSIKAGAETHCPEDEMSDGEDPPNRMVQDDGLVVRVT